MDTSSGGGMGMDMVVRQDPQLYMSPDEVMALFNDGSVDVASLFPPEFPQGSQQGPQPSLPLPQTTTTGGTATSSSGSAAASVPQQDLRGRTGTGEGVQWVFVS
jgi:hypothetical protein